MFVIFCEEVTRKCRFSTYLQSLDLQHCGTFFLYQIFNCLQKSNEFKESVKMQICSALKTQLAELVYLLKVGVRTVSVHTVSVRTVSIRTVSVCMVNVRTVSVHTVSVRTVSVRTASVRTASVCTVSVRTFAVVSVQ